MKSILLLGSGLMTESVIVYLLANPKVIPADPEPHSHREQRAGIG
jgi:hypothetical protein